MPILSTIEAMKIWDMNCRLLISIGAAWAYSMHHVSDLCIEMALLHPQQRACQPGKAPLPSTPCPLPSRVRFHRLSRVLKKYLPRCRKTC